MTAHLNTQNVIIEKESRNGLRKIAFEQVLSLITHSHTDKVTPAIAILV